MLNFSSINTMKPLLVWIAAQHRFLHTNNLVQCIGPIFRGQDVRDECPKELLVHTMGAELEDV